MPKTSGFIFQRTNLWQIGRKRVPIGPGSLSEVGATENDVFIQPDAAALHCPVVRILATRVHRPARVLRVRPPWPCPQTAAGRTDNDRPPSDFDGFQKCALPSLFFHSASGTRLRADGTSSYDRFSCLLSLCQFVWTGRKTQPAGSVPAHPKQLAKGVRKASGPRRMALCAKEPKWYSDTVIRVPEAFKGNDVVNVAYARCNRLLGVDLAWVTGQTRRLCDTGGPRDVGYLS